MCSSDLFPSHDITFEQFLAQSGTEDWLSKMGIDVSTEVETETPSVKVEPEIVKEVKHES